MKLPCRVYCSKVVNWQRQQAKSYTVINMKEAGEEHNHRAWQNRTEGTTENNETIKT
jgi:hypothetical protein